MGFGVLNSMLGPPTPQSLLCKLAGTELVAHMIVPLRANRCRTLPQSRLAKPGVAEFILSHFLSRFDGGRRALLRQRQPVNNTAVIEESASGNSCDTLAKNSSCSSNALALFPASLYGDDEEMAEQDWSAEVARLGLPSEYTLPRLQQVSEQC